MSRAVSAALIGAGIAALCVQPTTRLVKKSLAKKRSVVAESVTEADATAWVEAGQAPSSGPAHNVPWVDATAGYELA
jgi:hypothetical protein